MKKILVTIVFALIVTHGMTQTKYITQNGHINFFSSAPIDTKSVRSRVVVALEHFAMEVYFSALKPPLNPSGPSRNIRSRTFC